MNTYTYVFWVFFSEFLLANDFYFQIDDFDSHICHLEEDNLFKFLAFAQVILVVAWTMQLDNKNISDWLEKWIKEFMKKLKVEIIH